MLMFSLNQLIYAATIIYFRQYQFWSSQLELLRSKFVEDV